MMTYTRWKMMTNYTIDPRVYKLFLKLTDQQRYDFMKDLLKIMEDKNEPSRTNI